jgi:hypothetical protein
MVGGLTPVSRFLSHALRREPWLYREYAVPEYYGPRSILTSERVSLRR